MKTQESALTGLMLRVARLMADGVERSTEEVAIALDMEVTAAGAALRKLSREGAGQMLHVERITGNHGKRIYANGPGKNAGRKTSRTKPRFRESSSKALSGDLLPAAFRETGRALDAMMRVGRATQREVT
ncbi:hypothetical protein [Paraburkholderia sacchari]|uniref:hypothetical protein n=1 Tax=Paraburkholderia sacchari TaxID=159450 RepID=UPI001BCC9722|nr:hypothetical protein [Paraburkholderia sacchari]